MDGPGYRSDYEKKVPVIFPLSPRRGVQREREGKELKKEGTVDRRDVRERGKDTHAQRSQSPPFG